MGWKNIKEAYRIGHTVHVTAKGICIGSPYISEIIVIGADGRLTKRYEDRGNEDLSRYQREMEADPDKLKRLIETPDTFGESITVFTFDEGDIIEKKCESVGWPNVTHDGQLMYENTFSTDLAKVVRWAKENADCGVKFGQENLATAVEKLEACRKRLTEARAARAKLEATYPGATFADGAQAVEPQETECAEAGRGPLSLSDALARLREYNAWRRGESAMCPTPADIGSAIERLCAIAESQKPTWEHASAIQEILARGDVIADALKVRFGDCHALVAWRAAVDTYTKGTPKK